MEEEKNDINKRFRKSSTPEKQTKRYRHHLHYGGGGTTGRRKQRSRRHINLFEKSNIDELVDEETIHLHRDDEDYEDDYADLGTINDFEDEEKETSDHYKFKSDLKSARKEDESLV